MKRLLQCLILFLLPTVALPDVVIVNSTFNNQKTLSRHVLQEVYMLRPAYWDNGAKIVPVFINFDSYLHHSFISEQLHLNPNAYSIAKLDEIECTYPRLIVDSIDEVIAFVSKNPNAIAYINRSQLSSLVQEVKIKD